MKKGIIKVIVLFLLLCTAFVGTAFFLNQEKTVGIRDMKEPTLPVVYMQLENVLINPMYGYAQEMEEQYMRDSLTPMGTSRELTLVVDQKESKVASVEYQISTADGTTVIEKNRLHTETLENGKIGATFQLQHSILMNQEYTLRFHVTLDDGSVYYYYTRLIQRAGMNTSHYLEFAENFYQQCIAKGNEIATYLEPDETETNSTYATLNIHSSYERITWGQMKTTLEKKAIPVIKDINETTCSVAMDYVISDQTDEEEKEYYLVEDFYRMRYSQSRVMLLDFERETEKVFDGENPILTSTGINLGIVNKDIQYRYNKNEDIAAFVQAGELWSYNRSANKISRIYSFRDGELDNRKNLMQHNIKIVRVEESGDIDFVVYGYMNSDVHEGEVGIGVYHYGAELNQIREDAFIPMKTTYEYLKSDMEILSYVSKQDKLYLMLENDLYEIDAQNQSYRIVKENIQDDCYVVSKSQESIAWMNEMLENESTSITVMNLESGQQYQIQAGAGERIKAIGFVNEDLVYGLARQEDILVDNVGNITFGMHTARIEQFGGTIVKEQTQPDVWIRDVVIAEGLIEVQQVRKENGAYVEVESTHIMNTTQSSEEHISVRLVVTEHKATQIGLDFEKNISNKNVLYVESNLLQQTETGIIDLQLVRQDSNIYYVYAKGKLDSTWTKVSDAIFRANTQMGVVLNRQQQYVWERGNRDDSNKVNTEDVPSIILSGTIDEKTLQQSLGEGYDVLNMTGCTLDSVLYQVGKGNPVIAKVSDAINIVIIGYDKYNTILYYPVTQETGYYGINDSTALFENAGNVFVGYMEKMGTPSKSE